MTYPAQHSEGAFMLCIYHSVRETTSW